MTVGRNPYFGTPAPRPPAPSGAALTGRTGIARPNSGTAAGGPDHETGTDSLPPMEPAPPLIADTGWAAAAPPPSMPPSPPKPGRALAAAGAAPPSQPADLAICTPKLPIPTLKYGRPSVL